MHKYSTLILVALMVVGTVLTLIQLYTSTDDLQYPFTASLYYLGTSITMILLLMKFRKDTNKKLVIINNFVIIIFTLNSIVFALICLYALEPEGRVDSLASAIFFFAGMIAGSSVFFVRPTQPKLVTVSTSEQ